MSYLNAFTQIFPIQLIYGVTEDGTKWKIDLFITNPSSVNDDQIANLRRMGVDVPVDEYVACVSFTLYNVFMGNIINFFV